MELFPTGTIKAKTRQQKPYFTGFNTVGKDAPPFTLTNTELVKRDLSNHFNTPRGSRVMRPTYGTRIHELLFDPFDDITRQAIIEDARTVVASEPRVELVDIAVKQESHSLEVHLTLAFKPENVIDSLLISYQLRNND